MLRAVTFRTLTRVISLAALLLRYVLNMESSISQSLSVRCVCVWASRCDQSSTGEDRATAADVAVIDLISLVIIVIITDLAVSVPRRAAQRTQ